MDAGGEVFEGRMVAESEMRKGGQSGKALPSNQPARELEFCPGDAGPEPGPTD